MNSSDLASFCLRSSLTTPRHLVSTALELGQRGVWVVGGRRGQVRLLGSLRRSLAPVPAKGKPTAAGSARPAGDLGTLTQPDGTPFTRCNTGYGLAFVTRKVFDKAGGWPEFQSWGGEDNLFWDPCYRVASTERYPVGGLLHQWHPEEWKSENYARKTLSDWNETVAGGESAAAGGEFQCGRLSSRTIEDKRGDLTHTIHVTRSDVKHQSVSVKAFPSLGLPLVGCLRNAVLVLAVGDPVEGGFVIAVLLSGHTLGLLEKDAQLEFRDSEVILKAPLPIVTWEGDGEKEKVPPEFRELFQFIELKR